MPYSLPNNTTFSKENPPQFSHLEKSFAEFVNLNQWVASDGEGVPYIPFKGGNASSSDPRTWVKFPEAKKYCLGNPPFLPAIALQDSGLCIFDLDNVIDDSGAIEPWAQEIVDQTNSYTETSRSGRGIHIVCRGKKPGRRCRSSNKDKFEIYDGGHSKFITLTGNVLGNRAIINSPSDEIILDIYNKHLPDDESAEYSWTKSPLLSDEEVISHCSKAKNREKFKTLFTKGDISAYDNDASAADFALVLILAFYTQDEEQLFKIFKESALYKPGREKKWAREDYRKKTIQRALARLTQTWQPSQEKETKSSTVGTWENPAPIALQEDLDIPFPIECLPKIMRDAVMEVSRSVQVDPAMAVIPALGMLALQVGKKAIVEEKEGLEHYGSLFLVCIMKQVERKSEVYKRLITPIRKAIKEEEDEYKNQMISVQASNETLDEQIKAVKSQMKTPKEGETIESLRTKMTNLMLEKKELPVSPQNWVDDVTPERLQQLLKIHGEVYGLFSSEGRGVLHRIRDKDDKGGSVGKSIYTAATWGDPFGRSRVGKDGKSEDIYLDSPALTVVLFVQEDVWAEFSSDQTMRQNGTLSRICAVNPPSRVGSRLEQDGEESFDFEKIKPFTDAVINIHKWKPKNIVCTQLSKEAHCARRNFYNDLERESGQDGKYGDVADIVGRGCSLTARIALDLAVLDAASRDKLGENLPSITEEQWLNAQAIEECFLSYGIDAQRRHSHTGREYVLQKAARWLLKHIRTESEIRLTQLKKFVRGLTDENLKTIIDGLKGAGWLKEGEPTQRGLPSFQINPKIAVWSKEVDL